MTIRGLLMTSLMSLALGGCSFSFMGSPSSAAPRNDYGSYGYGVGKPIASADYGQIDGRGKPLHRGSAASTDDRDEKPTVKPAAPQRTKPAKPPQRTKPAPHRTKPTAADPTDTPTRPGSPDEPTRRPLDPDSIVKPTRRPLEPDSIVKPTRRPLDPDSAKPSPRPSIRPSSTKPDAPTRTPQLERAPSRRASTR
jgi:hypothetical protein